MKNRLRMVRCYWRLARWGCLAVLSVSLVAGCASDAFEKPTPLGKLSTSLPAERVWMRVFVAEEGRKTRAVRPYVDQQDLLWVDGAGELYAVDAKTGSKRWHRRSGLRLIGDIGADANLLFIGTREGEVAAFRRDNGEPVWRVRVSSEVLAAPNAAQGVVVVQAVDGKIIALDVADGRELWRYEANIPLLTLRGTSSPRIVDETVIAGLANGRLVALNLWDGELRWRTELAASRGRSELERVVDIDATPVIIGDTIYAVTFQGSVAAVALGSGRIIWSSDISSSRGLVVDESAVYVADDSGAITAFSRRSGAKIWRQDDLGYRGITGPASVKEYLVVGDREGYLHWIERDSGHIRHRMREDDQAIDSQPLVVDDVAYLVTQGGVLDAVTLAE